MSCILEKINISKTCFSSTAINNSVKRSSFGVILRSIKSKKWLPHYIKPLSIRMLDAKKCRGSLDQHDVKDSIRRRRRDDTSFMNMVWHAYGRCLFAPRRVFIGPVLFWQRMVVCHQKLSLTALNLSKKEPLVWGQIGSIIREITDLFKLICPKNTHSYLYVLVFLSVYC